MNRLFKISKAAVLSAIGVNLLLTGCNSRPLHPLELGAQSATATSPNQAAPGAPSAISRKADNSTAQAAWSQQDPGYTDLPQQPVDIPEPLPVPNIRPAVPGQPFTAKAVANTTAFQVPRFSKLVQVNGLYVHINLTWQPVQAAAEYWVFKDRIPDFVEARRETAYAIVPAGFAKAGFKDGLEPPNLSGGSLWDKVKKGFKMVSNRPGFTYKYKIIAADATGRPLSESNVFMASPLPAIPAPVLNQAQNTNTVEPLFTWKDGTQSNVPVDGYFVSVFPSVQVTGGTLPPTSLAFWSTYRPKNTKLARYGKDTANLTSYPGTLPFKLNFNLTANKNYSWTVLGTKTDTGNMKTAKAISRSWSGFGHFKIAPNARPSTRSAISSQSIGRYSAPRNVPQQQAPRRPMPTF